MLEREIPGAFAAKGQFVTRWLVIAEAVDPDGERMLWLHNSDEALPWDLIGMLEFGLALEKAALTAHVCGVPLEDDEDEDDPDDHGGAA